MVASLKVNRADLAEGIRQLSKFVKRRGTVRLDYEAGQLQIRAGRVVVTAAAEGSWLGCARVSPVLIAMLGSGLPSGDPVLVEVEAEHLRVGRCVAARTWSPNKRLSPQLSLF